jgi:U3 small nucleolar RNA-associated protein 25
MQNWSHVVTVMAALNGLPKEQHETDIMRVKPWYLAGHARHYRQTIALGSFLTPELNALIGRTCVNAAGTVRLLPRCRGVLGDILPQARQLFERLPLSAEAAPGADADARFEYFKAKVWPRIREAAHGGGQLLYVPSYFDFVRVRNFLKAESASFLALSEYTDRGDAARARTYFADGRKRVLVYTERAQFYNRHRLRGAKDIFFYQLPEHPHFYSELVNLLEEASLPGAELPTVTSVFGRFDGWRLGRVVGSGRAGKMLKKEDTSTFLFC